MKTLKILLVLYLTIHFTCVCLVNLMALTIFKESDEQLNKFGDSVVKIIEKPKFINRVENHIGFYVNITGVNRGYEFFSPNISNASIRLVFETKTGKEIPLFKSIESEMKFYTFSQYLNSSLADKKQRDNILKSVCSRLFTKDTDLNEIHVYADISLFESLETAVANSYIDNKGKILLTKITKNSHDRTSI